MDTQKSSNKSSGSNVTNPIEIVAQDKIHSVAFLADGEYIVSGGREEKNRKWRVQDGKEVMKPKNVGSAILDLAVMQDAVVCGTESGRVIVWHAKSHKKLIEFKAHCSAVNALDVSADATKIATGSSDNTLSVWSFPAGERHLGPIEHDFYVVAVKFSPDGRRVATATWGRYSVRVYDSSDGCLLADFPIWVGSGFNRSLTWASDSNRLFALSEDGDIHCFDVSTNKTLTKWRIHSDNKPRCIAVACNDTIIAVSANSSLSLWDSKTRRQIGPVIHDSHYIQSMAISPSYDIATAGDEAITLRNLCDIVPSSYRDNMLLEHEIHCLKMEKPVIYDMVMALRTRDAHQKDDIVNLEKTVQELRNQLATSNKEKKSLYESSNRKIVNFEKNVQELRGQLVTSSEEKTGLNEMIKSLCTQNETSDRQITHLNELGKELHSALVASQGSVDRLAQTIRALRADIDLPGESSAPVARNINELELSAQELGNQFSKCKCAIHVYDRKYECEILYASGRIYDAARHVANMMNDLWHNKPVIDWLKEFVHRCASRLQEIGHVQSLPPEFVHRYVSRLQEIGDDASSSRDHGEALSAYSTVLSLIVSPPQAMLAGISGIIVKCCQVRVGLLEDELVNVTQITERDSSNYKGYKRKHAILHSLGRYKEAFDAFEMMLSSMEDSLDPQVHNMRRCYLDTTPLIRQVVEQTIRDIPQALINTITGRLYDKAMQAAAFEQVPIFNELRSSMTTCDRLDRARIQREVESFYEYVMFSHRWQPPEPSFQMVENTVIYGLPASPTIDKLINFCKLVTSHRFRWAWSDTCCVNQSDKGVQQESVVSMFQWYCRAALTIVHLLGVLSESQEPGSLWKSIWNTRGWTYQEYVASRVVQFYTEDWKPYLGLKMFNHKESPTIFAEMEQATKFATQDLATLQPGLTRVYEKFYLASKRQTTRKEDAAYSLFGIFNIALPVIYGEGNQAVGRLLEHILTRSDNVTILAWTGISGNNHSYLPLDLTVYDHVVPPHLPQPVETAKIDGVIKTLQLSLLDPSLSLQLYEQLYNLPPLSLVAGRLRLSGLVFPLNGLERLPEHDSGAFLPVYRVTTPALGDVRIETKDNLVGMEGLVLIHPWISPLIDEDFSGITPQSDLAACALRLVVRLRQSFGALLLASQSRVQYKRVATDSFIKVQIQEGTPLQVLMDSVRTVDVQ